ncbi:endolytic transglycosylase MltG [Bacteroides sp. 224]|uniref:endolytic transglycosylase MltG n=1 Tax=Bacteroides sp. 224 TaxID=2302936 RepID=UPI0013D3018D|nr:endolytic transglycosylase MltG [Bacteroides sp. 224]NDV67110.1 endolytic transglycosylase MltG [Bacteroides sp. 224]
MKKTSKIILLIFCIAILIGGASAGFAYYYLLAPQFHPSQTVYIYIDKDDTIDSIYTKVKESGNPHKFEGFHWIAEYKKYKDNIRTGRYAIKPGDDVYHLYQRLAGGAQTPTRLTIGSVRTLDKLARNVSNQLMIDSTEVANKLFNRTFIESIGYDKETLPSLFIPNTYEVYWNISVDDFFNRMIQEHDRFWNKDRLAKAEAIGLTPQQVSTLASIVDEETNANDEKKTVAGLYMNRLLRGMLLQADPTVKFAWQDFELRRILFKHLEIDSPYNTYKYTGLPPGPIRIPTIAGIDAVLNYEKHSYLYMTAKEDFSGKHNFAVTLSQHNENARKYHEALNKRKIFE